MDQVRFCLPLAFILVLTCASGVVAQPVERPVYKVGDSWTYRHATGATGFRPGGTFYVTETRTVTKVGAGDFDMASESTAENGEKTSRVLTSSLDFNDFARTEPNAPRLEIRQWIWPAEVGRTWKYEITRGAGTEVWEVRVLGWEDVEVPAGKFRALKVEREMVSTPSADGRGAKEIVWFAPEAKVNVRLRRESVYRTFVTQNFTRELIAYKLER